MKKYSRNQLKTLAKQGAIERNGKVIGVKELGIPLEEGDIIKLGKKEFYRIHIA